MVAVAAITLANLGRRSPDGQVATVSRRIPDPNRTRICPSVVSNRPEKVPRLSSREMSFVLNDEARKWIVEDLGRACIAWSDPRHSLVI